MATFVSSISPSLSSIMHGNSLACEVAIRVRVFSIPKFRTVWRPSLIAQMYEAGFSIRLLPVRRSWVWDEPCRSRARMILLKLFFEAVRIFLRNLLSLPACFLTCALCLSQEKPSIAQGLGLVIVWAER